MSDDSISMPAAKVISLWALIGITSWTEAAAFAGFVYSMLLISEWLWKKAARPFAESKGWLVPRKRLREVPDTDYAGLP